MSLELATTPEVLSEELRTKIEMRTAKVGIVGLGYVGLPLAETFAWGGYPVLGFDIDPDKVEKLRRGESYIGHIKSERVRDLVRTGRFDATTDNGRFREADCIIICVPTPLTECREPDLSYIESTARAIMPHLRPGQLVVLESTTYPGTTEDCLRPILEQSGLQAGVDFFLAYSPEREDPGNKSFATRNIPKVVGGIDDTSRDLAVALYGPVVEGVVPVSSTGVAEACKILENTYRAVNIALVNELKVVFDRMGIDVWEVIAAAKTKPFGFQAFYPGPGLGGHCLAGSEYVHVRDAAGVHTLRFEELFARYQATTAPDGVDQAAVDGLEALSVNPETGQAEFARVTDLFKRTSPTPLLKLRIRGNRSLTVTDGHPMLVCDAGRIAVRRAEDLKAGDSLVLMTTWPDEEPWSSTVDFIDVAARRGLEGIRVQPREGRWADHDAVVRPATRARGYLAKDVYRHNTLPLTVYLDLEQQGKAPFRRGEVLLATGKGCSWNHVPAVFEMDEDFARLVGYYLSEGCITRDKSWRVRWAFGGHEAELLQDLTSILERFGFRYSVDRLKTCNTVQVKVSSLFLSLLLRDELGCGVRSEDACVPARLMAAPAPVRRQLLAGLLRGDGDVDAAAGPRAYRKNGREYVHTFIKGTVGYFTSSPVLFQQAILLLQSEGLVPAFRKGRPHMRLSGSQVEALEPLMVGAKQERLAAYRTNRTREAPPRSYEAHDNFATVALVAVERVEPGPVYSMEVEGNHTFVTSYGIAVHNCIPIDPFYLTWVARRYGVNTRFIELAGEVNTSMPGYVVQRVGEALNEHGKAIKGSRICILGIAYKKDVDDPRESPAFEILEMLQKRGAVVSYNDPHIPESPRMRHHSIRLESQPLTPEYLAAQDCVLIVTDHSAYDYGYIIEHARLVVDTRNATAGCLPTDCRIWKA